MSAEARREHRDQRLPAPDTALMETLGDLPHEVPLWLQIAAMPPEELRALARDLAERLEEQGKTIAELRARVDEQEETIDRMRLEKERVDVELLVLRRARRELPSTVGDLRLWREARGLTQAEAARHLHVGRATIERAEAQDHDTPLGPALRRAFGEDAQSVAAAEDSARSMVPIVKGTGAARVHPRRRA